MNSALNFVMNTVYSYLHTCTRTHTHTLRMNTVPPSTAGNGDGDSVKVDEGGGGDGLMAEDEIDLRAFRLAGGPILLELLEMPPQPKVANNWTIKKGVIFVEYLYCMPDMWNVMHS